MGGDARQPEQTYLVLSTIMKKSQTITAADLFCGAGGTSTGLRQACDENGTTLKLIAVNHWQIAIDTHSKNHPESDDHCASLDTVNPRELVPSGRLDLLVASPECTHHSNARGGKPINDQSRASAWRIVEWASQIRIQSILIENVKEFRTWGPLGVNGRPLKRRQGETYLAFLGALRALGYKVEDRVLNAADYGDPTSRERLFIQARLGRQPIVWPEPTHAPMAKIENKNKTLFDVRSERIPYRTAREIIDWTIPSQSIFNRKRPLKPNTLNRIYRGLEEFCGIPFIVPQEGDDRIRSIDRPLQTVKTQSLGLVQPFLVKFYGGHDAQTLDEPLPTITANYEHYGLARPFIVLLRNGQVARSVDEPLTTVTTKGMHHALCQPYIVVLRNNADAQSLDVPLRTLTTGGNFGLAQPFIVAMEHGGSVRPIDKPLNTITTAKGGAHGLAQPFLIKYYGTGSSIPVTEPLDTVTAKDRFGLVEPHLSEGESLAVLDIHFRMLQPRELAAAMGFPKTYFFTGNREAQVKQIGNAVPVNLARALCQSIIAR